MHFISWFLFSGVMNWARPLTLRYFPDSCHICLFNEESEGLLFRFSTRLSLRIGLFFRANWSSWIVVWLWEGEWISFPTRACSFFWRRFAFPSFPSISCFLPSVGVNFFFLSFFLCLLWSLGIIRSDCSRRSLASLPTLRCWESSPASLTWICSQESFTKLLLATNSVLTPAIAMYRSFGFRVIKQIPSCFWFFLFVNASSLSDYGKRHMTVLERMILFVHFLPAAISFSPLGQPARVVLPLCFSSSLFSLDATIALFKVNNGAFSCPFIPLSFSFSPLLIMMASCTNICRNRHKWEKIQWETISKHA